MVRNSTKDDDTKKVATTWVSTSAKGKQVSGWIDKATSRFHEILVAEVQSNRVLDGMDEREEDMLKNFAITAGVTKKKKRRFQEVVADDDIDNKLSAPNYLLTMGQTTAEI